MTRSFGKSGLLRSACLAVSFFCFTSTISEADILIGTAAPMTGPYAWSGEQFRVGSEMAVQDINSDQGLLGEQVRLIVGDDAANPEQAVAVAEKFVSDGVVFVAGHWASGASIAASRIYEEAGILMISPSSTNPKLTDEGGANVFRVCGRDDRQGAVAGEFLAEKWGQEKIAIVHDGTAYGEGLAAETKKHLNERGVSETLYRGFAPGGSDYSPLISELQAAAIDVIYVGGYAPDAGLMIRQARDQGYDLQLVSGDALSTQDFWLMTGSAGDGTLFTFFPDPRFDPDNAELIERFRAVGIEPDGYTLYAYGAVQTWAQAVKAAGTLELPALIQTLRTNTFETVLGELDFDANGDIKSSGFGWYVWNAGEYLPIVQSSTIQ